MPQIQLHAAHVKEATEPHQEFGECWENPRSLRLDRILNALKAKTTIRRGKIAPEELQQSFKSPRAVVTNSGNRQHTTEMKCDGEEKPE
jgi:hypothetical protein